MEVYSTEFFQNQVFPFDSYLANGSNQIVDTNYLAYEIIEPRPCDSCYVTKAKKGEKKVYLRTFLVC